MEVSYKQALKAVKQLQAYCNKFANCVDCPLSDGIECNVRHPMCYCVEEEANKWLE